MIASLKSFFLTISWASALTVLCIGVGTWYLVLMVPNTLAQSDEPRPLAGSYVVAGTGAQGAYHGTATIQQRGSVIYLVWMFDHDQHGGFGLIRGSQVAVGFSIGPETASVVIYQIKDDTLQGEWANPDGQIFSEVLTRKAVGPQAQR